MDTSLHPPGYGSIVEWRRNVRRITSRRFLQREKDLETSCEETWGDHAATYEPPSLTEDKQETKVRRFRIKRALDRFARHEEDRKRLLELQNKVDTVQPDYPPIVLCDEERELQRRCRETSGIYVARYEAPSRHESMMETYLRRWRIRRSLCLFAAAEEEKKYRQNPTEEQLKIALHWRWIEREYFKESVFGDYVPRAIDIDHDSAYKMYRTYPNYMGMWRNTWAGYYDSNTNGWIQARQTTKEDILRGMNLYTRIDN